MTGSIVVVGAGGAIGSHLVPHLGRMAGIRRVTLIDHDVYEAKNLASQDITRRDLGRPKAMGQARRLRRIAPEITATAVAERVEDVPLGLLHGDVLLACLDSRAARRTVNLCAWRLGVPWIDAGVRREDLLARVNVYRPGPDEPCLECAWEDRDYETAEQAYPCAADEGPAPTNAPSGLGALAAALQALECEKLLAGRHEHVAAGSQVTISALGHRHYVTRFAANPGCRFDHARWNVEALDRQPDALALAETFRLGRGALGAQHEMRLGVANQLFASALGCPACGHRREFSLRLLGRLGAAARACPQCGRPMRAGGGDVVEWLAASGLPPALRQASLGDLGARPGDVVTLAGPTGVAHFQIGGVA